MPKYSILIPTRNGARYLSYAVRSVLSQPYDDCEVIVSVNHSSDNSLELLKQFNDPRLKVLVPPEPLSMVGHWEWLLKHASGEWITIIGDDDAVMPYFFEELENILHRWPHVSAISCRKAYYFWEGCQEIYGKAAVRYESARYEKLVNARLMLLKTLAGFKAHSDMPQLYANAVISRKAIQRILSLSDGKFYHESTPDVYSGVAFAATHDRYLRIELPLFWIGSSPKSNGMAFEMQAQNKATEESRRLAAEFETMVKKDNFGVAKEVGFSLWGQGISAVFVLSALRKLPFPVPRFRGRWIEYLVFAVVRLEIEKRRMHREQAQNLIVAYHMQAKQLKLSPSILAMSRYSLQALKLVLKLTAKPRRLLRKMCNLEFKIDKKLFSDDHQSFDDIDVAGFEVVKLYAKHKT